MRRLGWWIFENVPLRKIGCGWAIPHLFGLLIGAKNWRQGKVREYTPEEAAEDEREFADFDNCPSAPLPGGVEGME